LKTILDFSDPWQQDAPRLRHGFGQPLEALVAWQPHEVPAVLDAVQRAAEQGLWCAGWLAYEAASAFDTAYAGTVHGPLAGQPLAWFGLHRAPLAQSSRSVPESGASAIAPLQWQSTLQRSAFDSDGRVALIFTIWNVILREKTHRPG